MISLYMQGGCLCENMPGLRHDITTSNRRDDRAPALLMVSATGDWTAETMEREFPAVRSAYALFDAASKLHAVRFTAEHNYNKDSREPCMRGGALEQNAPEAVRRPERGFTVNSLADLMVFHGRPLPDGAVTPDELTARWIASAKRSLPPPTVSRCSRRCVTRWASAKRLPPRPPLPRSQGGPRRRRAATTPDVDAALRQAGFEIRPVTFTAFDEPSAAKVRHFDTYNRYRRQPRVADIVAALRQSPSAVLIADAPPRCPRLAAASSGAAHRLRTSAASTQRRRAVSRANDIPGVRRAGDFQTAAGWRVVNWSRTARATGQGAGDQDRARSPDATAVAALAAK